MPNALTIDKVTKKFGPMTAVDQISFSIPRGSIYGFLGPNGAGKTTTIRMIMGILYPDSGTIRVLGQPNAEAVKSRLGYLPEERGLYKKMTVGDILTYFGRLKGMTRSAARSRGRQMVEQVGLGEWIDKRCETLSKGMSQKVQVLAAIIHDPELVILDEPFSGLDPVNIELMRDLILDMKRAGKTVVFSTHIMERAEQICDFVLLINGGRKLLDGSLSEVKETVGGAILLDYDGDGAVLKRLQGIHRINDSGKQVEIFVQDGVDPQTILAQLVGRIRVRRFEIRQPSLHEVFVRNVGGNGAA